MNEYWLLIDTNEYNYYKLLYIIINYYKLLQIITNGYRN